MARAFTLGTLVTRCQQRADAESDDHLAEWKSLISEKYGELYAVVAEAGCAYFQTTSDITATGAATYAMPADELTIISVDFIADATTGRKIPLRLLMPQERSTWGGATGQAIGYAFAGLFIELYPRPSSGTYRITYIPQPTDYSASADGTSIDVINTDGEAFLIWGVAASAKDKSEADLRFANQKSEEAKIRLQTWALNRALHEPMRRITDSIEDRLIDMNDGWYR